MCRPGLLQQLICLPRPPPPFFAFHLQLKGAVFSAIAAVESATPLTGVPGTLSAKIWGIDRALNNTPPLPLNRYERRSIHLQFCVLGDVVHDSLFLFYPHYSLVFRVTGCGLPVNTSFKPPRHIKQIPNPHLQHFRCYVEFYCALLNEQTSARTQSCSRPTWTTSAGL